MDIPFLRTPYNYDMNEASDASGLLCLEPTLAKQAFREEADINVIMERFGLGYVVPPGVVAPTFGDFTDVVDFHSAMNAVVASRESFMKLPADVRARFANDPQAFVAFCSDDSNFDEVDRMGLLLPAASKRRADAAKAASEAALELAIAARAKLAPQLST